jgi:hypothetical protein
MATTCCVDLNDIPKFCGGVNAPGLNRQLHIACGEDVKTIPQAAGHKITSNIIVHPAVVAVAANPTATPPIEAITAVPAGKFYTWNFAKEDQEFTSDRDDNGLWKTVVKMFIPKMEADKSNVLNNSTGDDKIVVFQDRNGKSRLVGSDTEGCTIKVKEQATPKNGYVVEVMWESAHSPYFYEGTI